MAITHTPTTHHASCITRGEEEIEIAVESSWSYNSGVFIEAGHSMNGHGRGWECRELTARNAKTFQLIELTGSEIEDETARAFDARLNQ